LRFALLRKLGWQGLIRFDQQRALFKDLVRGLVLVPFHGTKLRENWLVRMVFRKQSGERLDRRPQPSTMESNGVRYV
jgi:hypothetical protein